MDSLKEVKIYVNDRGEEPFLTWLNNYKDKKVHSKILRRIDRARNNNYGYHKRLKADLLELKENSYGGLRVYLGEDGTKIIILLLGGDKSSQNKDIKKALKYWEDYKNMVKKK